MAAIATGLLSWASGDGWNGWFVTVHGVIGISLLLLVPAKLRGSVRTGFRRKRASRWLSAAFGVLVLVTLALGLLHATGRGSVSATGRRCGPTPCLERSPSRCWCGTSPLARRDRGSPTSIAGRFCAPESWVAAAAVYVGQETMTRVSGLAGGRRRSTGSHEVASHDPANMPSVSWFDDNRPEIEPEPKPTGRW